MISFMFFSSCVIYAQSGIDYYPLGMNNFWVYKHAPADDSTAVFSFVRREVAGFQNDGEGKVISVKNVSAARDSYQWYKISSKGEIALISLGIGPDIGSSLADFDPPLVLLPGESVAGNSWEMKMEVAVNNINKMITIGVCRIESDRENVTVPAGTFRNCLKVRQTKMDENGKESGTIYVYYAHGVGNILTEQVAPPANRFRDELVEYSIK